MKKVVLAVVILLTTQTAYAVPKGCFITDTDVNCYYGYFFSSDCKQYNMTSYNFGSYIDSMCNYVNTVEASNVSCDYTLTLCKDTVTAVATERDNATALYGTSEQNRQQWIAYAGKRDKLIAKLYKACGSKCRRIK